MNPEITSRLPQVFLVIFSQFMIIAMLDMSDPYWPLILSTAHHFNARTLSYWSGAVYVAPLTMTIFTTLLWTKVGGRLGYKKMILRAGFTLAVTQWGLFFFSNPWAILSLRLIQGALAGFTSAVQAWSLAVTPTRTHNQIVGHLQTATAMGSIVGPIGGGFVAHYFGYSAIFTISACVCFLLSAILSQYLKENEPITSQKLALKPQRFLLGQSDKACLLWLICGAQAARWMSAPFFALYLVGQVHMDSLRVGLVYASLALSMSAVTSSLGAIMDRRPIWRARMKVYLMVALVFSGLAQWGFAGASQSSFAFILSVLWGIGLGIISLTLFSLLLKDMHNGQFVGIIGSGNTALKTGNLLGIVMGTLVQAYGHFILSFFVIGCVYFVLAWLTLSYVR